MQRNVVRRSENNLSERSLWDVPEFALINCINCAVFSGFLPMGKGPPWTLKRSQTAAEKEVDPEFVIVEDGGGNIHAAPCLIELGIRAGCLEDRGDGRNHYRLIP